MSKWISIKLTRSEDWSFIGPIDDHYVITVPNKPFKCLIHFGPSIATWAWIDGSSPIVEPEGILEGEGAFDADYRKEIADYAKNLVHLLKIYEDRV